MIVTLISLFMALTINIYLMQGQDLTNKIVFDVTAKEG